MFSDPVLVVLNLADYSWSAPLESGKVPIIRKGHAAIVDGNKHRDINMRQFTVKINKK